MTRSAMKLVFAVAVAVSCWGFALIPIWRAKMATITFVPVLLGLVAAVRDLAIGRTVVAIIENCQRADGTIAVPKALQAYMHAETI